MIEENIYIKLSEDPEIYTIDLLKEKETVIFEIFFRIEDLFNKKINIEAIHLMEHYIVRIFMNILPETSVLATTSHNLLSFRFELNISLFENGISEILKTLYSIDFSEELILNEEIKEVNYENKNRDKKARWYISPILKNIYEGYSSYKNREAYQCESVDRVSLKDLEKVYNEIILQLYPKFIFAGYNVFSIINQKFVKDFQKIISKKRIEKYVEKKPTQDLIIPQKKEILIKMPVDGITYVSAIFSVASFRDGFIQVLGTEVLSYIINKKYQTLLNVNDDNYKMVDIQAVSCEYILEDSVGLLLIQVIVPPDKVEKGINFLKSGISLIKTLNFALEEIDAFVEQQRDKIKEDIQNDYSRYSIISDYIKRDIRENNHDILFLANINITSKFIKKLVNKYLDWSNVRIFILSNPK